MAREGSLVGQAFEITPGRHPRHPYLVGGFGGGETFGTVADPAGYLVGGAGCRAFRGRGFVCGATQFGDRPVDLYLAGRVGTRGQGLSITLVPLESVAESGERERFEQVRQRPVCHGGAHHLQIAFGRDGDDVGSRA